jgi:hypothetical protein
MVEGGRCRIVALSSPRISHSAKTSSPVSQDTASAARPGQGRDRSSKEAFMRSYLAVVLTILGLLGVYVALQPLLT